MSVFKNQLKIVQKYYYFFTRKSSEHSIVTQVVDHSKYPIMQIDINTNREHIIRLMPFDSNKNPYILHFDTSEDAKYQFDLNIRRLYGDNRMSKTQVDTSSPSPDALAISILQ